MAVTYYTGKERASIGAYVRRMAIGLGAATLCVLAGLVYSRLAHVRWLSIGLTLLWGAALIFLWGMKLSPALAYRKFLAAIEHATERAETGVVVALADRDSYQDGMTFSTLRINTDDKMDVTGERMFYVDSGLPQPMLSPGDRVVVTACGNYLTGWERADADSR